MTLNRIGERQPRWRPWLGKAWVIGCLLASAFCVYKGQVAASAPKSDSRLISSTNEVRRTKRMDEIEENDIVLARDEFGTEIGPRRVVQVFRRTSDHLRLLTFESPDGTQQTIKTTDEHPFGLADSLGFIPAGELKVGHEVPGPNGERQTLIATVREEHHKGIPVFNFEVECAHTYFVSNDAGASLLVHNQCARDLGNNLTAAGSPRTSSFDVPHHIVPRGSYRGNLDIARAKEILTRNGIDLDDAENGVWLPSSRLGATSGTIHERIHTNDYFRQVANRLADAEAAGTVAAELGQIATELVGGAFLPF